MLGCVGIVFETLDDTLRATLGCTLSYTTLSLVGFLGLRTAARVGPQLVRQNSDCVVVASQFKCVGLDEL